MLLPAFLLAAIPGVVDVDTDGDGLSDFAEVEKYGTDPREADTDRDGVPDGDWAERREYAYTVRTVVRVLPPVTDDVLSDDHQDARVLERTPGYVELEVVHYPLGTAGQAIPFDLRWKQHAAELSAWTDPGPTANWDDAMRLELTLALARDGIDAGYLDDKRLVERASHWLLDRARLVDGFTTFCTTFQGGSPSILPGLESAAARGTADKSLSTAEQWQREIFARGMFANRVRGSCTSTAIYLSGCLRALGVPTRIVLAIPCVDPSDPREVEMIRRGITHKGVRRIVLAAIEGQAGAWVSHTMNEVFVGGRWRRLNYARLGQPILDREYLGLMTHVATFGDWADGDMARTWGIRQAQAGPHDDTFGGPNPYSTSSVSDAFGVHARVANDLLLSPDEASSLSIEGAYWWSSSGREVEMDLRGADPAGHFLVHVREGKANAGSDPYRAFWSGCSKEFVLRAEGRRDVRARATRGYWCDPAKGVQEFHLEIAPSELAGMARGVAYALASLQTDEDFRWTVAGSVSLTRP